MKKHKFVIIALVLYLIVHLVTISRSPLPWFDEVFFVGLPTQTERQAIFTVHLTKFRPLNLRSYDCDRLAYETPNFSGAEIEQAIIEGMYSAFNQNRDLATEDIVEAIKNTFPLASTAREQINYMKAWAEQGRARSASSLSNLSTGLFDESDELELAYTGITTNVS